MNEIVYCDRCGVRGQVNDQARQDALRCFGHDPDTERDFYSVLYAKCARLVAETVESATTIARCPRCGFADLIEVTDSPAVLRITVCPGCTTVLLLHRDLSLTVASEEQLRDLAETDADALLRVFALRRMIRWYRALKGAGKN
jgi:DNA-directed RNA polymerase subunit RPC12/RpoP